MAETTAVVDVDGTLVDSNYHHALCWYRAFRAFDITLPVWHLHRAIGMGGDKLVAAVAGQQVEEELGDAVRKRWRAEFDAMIDEVRPLEGARELLADLGDRGVDVVLASSGKPEHVDRFLDLIDGRSVAGSWTTSDDVEQSKPAPELIERAVARSRGGDVVVIGDSVWDLEAARRAGYRSYALRTGGFSEQELTDAGAARVFESLQELRARLDDLFAPATS